MRDSEYAQWWWERGRLVTLEEAKQEIKKAVGDPDRLYTIEWSLAVSWQDAARAAAFVKEVLDADQSS